MSAYSYTLKMEDVDSSGMLITSYKTTQRTPICVGQYAVQKDMSTNRYETIELLRTYTGWGIKISHILKRYKK